MASDEDGAVVVGEFDTETTEIRDLNTQTGVSEENNIRTCCKLNTSG